MYTSYQEKWIRAGIQSRSMLVCSLASVYKYQVHKGRLVSKVFSITHTHNFIIWRWLAIVLCL